MVSLISRLLLPSWHGTVMTLLTLPCVILVFMWTTVNAHIYSDSHGQMYWTDHSAYVVSANHSSLVNSAWSLHISIAVLLLYLLVFQPCVIDALTTNISTLHNQITSNILKF